MRIFLAGATGAVGQRLVPLLASAGHSIVGLTRSLAKAPLLRKLGAEPVVADALDRRAIQVAVQGARPDVIVHEMTDLKGASDLRAFDRSFAASNRLRTEGTDHLLAAAREVGVQRFLAQSFCGWPYARLGSEVKTGGDPLDPDPPKELSRTLAAIRYLEDIVTQSSLPEGIVLRYGAFYGDNTGLFDGPLLEQIRRRRAPVVGSGNGWWSFVHIDDAAQATALAIERGVGGALYNIVDDEPAAVRDWLPVLAKLLGAKPPRHVPAWLARIVGGEHLVVMMTEGRAGSNARGQGRTGMAARPSILANRLCKCRGALAPAAGSLSAADRLDCSNVIASTSSPQSIGARPAIYPRTNPLPIMAQPRPMPTEVYAPTTRPKQVIAGVWIVDGPTIRFDAPCLRLPFPTRMTIIRLAGKMLFVHSPTPLLPDLRSELRRAGHPHWIVGPNRLHYWWIPEWRAAFPDAGI